MPYNHDSIFTRVLTFFSFISVFNNCIQQVIIVFLLAAKNCFSAAAAAWGWTEFISLRTFSEADKGFLVKDTCILEAEVTVHGIAKVL